MPPTKRTGGTPGLDVFYPSKGCQPLPPGAEAYLPVRDRELVVLFRVDAGT
jgi:hypothetical protein